MLFDEILKKNYLSNLGDQTFPESVRMILVLNPQTSEGSPLTLPPSFLHVTLTTPYRSTIAITSFARFIAKYKVGLVVPEGDFGSDVEGFKPIVFDVGKDKRKMEEALDECHKQLRDNVTVVYYNNNGHDCNQKQIEKWMKTAGADWDCYHGDNFFGWEDNQVVVVAGAAFLMEMITRAKTMLYILLVDHDSKTKGFFQQAAEQRLVEMK